MRLPTNPAHVIALAGQPTTVRSIVTAAGAERHAVTFWFSSDATGHRMRRLPHPTRPRTGTGARKGRGAQVFGVVGKDGGYTRRAADECVVIPIASPDRITPHTEGLCAVIWHLLVSHPALKAAATKWESVSAGR